MFENVLLKRTAEETDAAQACCSRWVIFVIFGKIDALISFGSNFTSF